MRTLRLWQSPIKRNKTMESTVAHLQNLYDKLWTQVDLLNENIEPSK